MPLSSFHAERARQIEPGLYSSVRLKTKKLRFLPGLLSEIEKIAA